MTSSFAVVLIAATPFGGLAYEPATTRIPALLIEETFYLKYKQCLDWSEHLSWSNGVLTLTDCMKDSGFRLKQHDPSRKRSMRELLGDSTPKREMNAPLKSGLDGIPIGEPMADIYAEQAGHRGAGIR